MCRAKILQAGLFVAVVAAGATMLAWVSGRTEIGIAMRDSGGALMTALIDSDGGVPAPGERHAAKDAGGPASAARYAEVEGGSDVSHHMA